MKKWWLLLFLLGLTGCGFKPRGAIPLAPPLHRLYLETPDPYGQLTRNLRQFLKLSGVTLAETPAEASSILTILSENTNDQLLGINGTQQTRQYNLILTVTFQVSNSHHRTLVTPQTVSESRALTVINDQILASSNEAMSLYNQMRQDIAYDILNRLSSLEISNQLTEKPTPSPASVKTNTSIKEPSAREATG